MGRAMAKIPYSKFTSAPAPLSFEAKISLKLDEDFLRAIIAGKRPLHWGIAC